MESRGQPPPVLGEGEVSNQTRPVETTGSPMIAKPSAPPVLEHKSTKKAVSALLPATTVFTTLLQQRARTSDGSGRSDALDTGRGTKREKVGKDRIRVGCAEIDGYVLSSGNGGRVEKVDSAVEGRGREMPRMEVRDVNEMGLERGVVVGVSGDLKEESVRVLSLQLLASTLLDSSQARATIIDSTGSFPLRTLQQIIHHRILQDLESKRRRKENQRTSALAKAAGVGTFGGARDRGTSRISTRQKSVDQDVIDALGAEKSIELDDVEVRVQTALERVNICRVFDIQGVWEVLGDVQAEYVQHSPIHNTDDNNVEPEGRSYSGIDGPIDENSRAAQAEPAESHTLQKKLPVKEKPAEIGDSEEDDSDVESPLSSAPISPEAPGDHPRDFSAIPDPWPLQEESHEEEAPIDENEKGTGGDTRLKTEMIIIDNMTVLINDLFARTERVAAHKLLTTLTQNLHSFSRTRNILILLINNLSPSTNSPKTVMKSNVQSDTAPNPHTANVTAAQRKIPSPSIFASATSRPALGKVFSSMLDLHIFLHDIPKSREDAEVLYRGDEGEQNNSKSQQEVTYSSILEVLLDRCPHFSSFIYSPSQELATGAEAGAGEIKTASEDVQTAWEDLQVRRERAMLRRTYRWCAINIGEPGEGFRIRSAFAAGRGSGKRPRLGRVQGAEGGPDVEWKEGLNGVSNIAKLYGFGGRQV